MAKIVSDILRPINTSGIIILGVFTILWGFWVGNPLWDAFDTAPLFKEMSLAPEWVWGVAAFAAGITMLYGVFMDKYIPLTRGALAGWAFWFVVSCFFFVGDWQNTGGITTLTIWVYCAFVWLNLRVNRAIFDDNAQ